MLKDDPTPAAEALAERPSPLGPLPTTFGTSGRAGHNPLMELDVVVTGGLVYVGSGRVPLRTDVGVAGGRIRVLDDLGAATARLRVDASGLAVAPGCIDTHTHSDLVWELGDEHADLATATVRQGVTTEVAGNRGFTCYPCLPERRAGRPRPHAG